MFQNSFDYSLLVRNQNFSFFFTLKLTVKMQAHRADLNLEIIFKKISFFFGILLILVIIELQIKLNKIFVEFFVKIGLKLRYSFFSQKSISFIFVKS